MRYSRINTFPAINPIQYPLFIEGLKQGLDAHFEMCRVIAHFGVDDRHCVKMAIGR